MYRYFVPSTPISGLVYLSHICDASEDDANVALLTDDTATYSKLEATSTPTPTQWKGSGKVGKDSVLTQSQLSLSASDSRNFP